MILKKVALPVGVDGKSYWEAMILGITNDKFCSQTWKWFSDTNEISIYGQEPYQELLRIFKELKSSNVWNTLHDH
jgi:hypothetical protein